MNIKTRFYHYNILALENVHIMLIAKKLKYISNGTHFVLVIIYTQFDVVYLQYDSQKGKMKIYY